MALPPSRVVWPTASLLLAAVISGLAWLPLRMVEGAGVGGLWVTLSVVAIACVPLLPGLAKCRGLTGRELRDLIWIALLIGVAWTFYTASLTTTDVVRAILLFYIAPVWGTLLEVFVLRQVITLRRIGALALGAAGLFAILGAGDGFGLAMNVGDVLALLSGMLWSVGLLVVFRRSATGVAAQSIAVALGALAGAIVIVLLLERAPVPGLDVLASALPWIVLTGLAFILPLWVLSLWAARSVSPARATLIFMAEVCVGVGSAAIWADQPFGLRQTIGTALVLAAAAVEFTGTQAPALAPHSAPPG